MHIGKQGFAILEVVQRRQVFLYYKIAEELLAGVVGGDTRRDNYSRHSIFTNQRSRRFREYHVGVDVTGRRQRIAFGLAQKPALGFGIMLCRLEFYHKRGLGLFQLLYQLLPFGLVGGGRYVMVLRLEKFLLLQLDPLPRRVPQHAVEPVITPPLPVGEAPR
ncbi:MAG: hypothetical protein BWY96_03145 [Spirochaetes bacterium ADurb.BinA120]|nr:MAG: hypothetical protein BWY96_03145 [Spirochaetes bacterium ADurb.BinA120]